MFLDKLPDHRQLGFALDGVFLLEHFPLHADAAGLELFHLRFGLCERQKRIGRAVRDEKRLLLGHGRLPGDELLRLMRVATDANQTSEPVRIANTHLERHQATLRKTEHKRLFRCEAIGALSVEQVEQQAAAALHADARFVINVVPRKAAVIVVRRIGEQDVEPWVVQRAGQPAEALHAVAQPV
ncbi:uncharacterized protein METZ01_LOCUS171082 [marine metagenome]|uniref:Uncharacterized protein n=1 Tax=marine metagenome TaxID=408172 RepID=A0A382BWQ3_9ZZZZ